MYQDIYKGLNKKSSDEQIRKLAFLMGMKKEAKFPSLAGKKMVRPLAMSFNGQKPSGMDYKKALKRLGIGTGVGASIFGTSYALRGDSGARELQSRLSSVEAARDTAQKKVNQQTSPSWGNVWDAFLRWLNNLFTPSTPASTDSKTPSASTAANTK